MSGLKNDKWIMEQAKKGMITPWAGIQVNDNMYRPEFTKTISYGLGSYGYDMRLANEFKIFTNYWPGIIDPKAFSTNVRFHQITVNEPDGYVIIPPNSFALARSVETFKIPRNVMTIVLGKSTYARCGLIVNITALEPEWEGQVTIELSNTVPLPMKVYVNEGIAQVLFFEVDQPCLMSYADKHGKYQGQQGITLPKV
jgi:dCTP deaminase